MKKTSILIMFILVAAVAMNAQEAKEKRAVEVINSASVEYERLVFAAFSSGCTDKSSFVLNIKEDAEYYEIELVRVRQDFCKAMPEPVAIIFTKDELKGRVNFKKPIKIVNPLYHDKWYR